MISNVCDISMIYLAWYNKMFCNKSMMYYFARRVETIIKKTLLRGSLGVLFIW